MSKMQHFFIRDRLIASQPAPKHWVHGSFQHVTGKAYFCPHCSHTWALALVDNEETYVENIPCEKHKATPSRSSPGCLTLPGNTEWNESLPDTILERDFLLLMEHRGFGLV